MALMRQAMRAPRSGSGRVLASIWVAVTDPGEKGCGRYIAATPRESVGLAYSIP